MRKSPLGVAKYFVGGMKMAVTHPQSDKWAKRQVLVWGLLEGVTLVNLTMALLLGTMNGFIVGFTLVGLCLYTVSFRWALDGLRYRANLRRSASERDRFNQIVSGM
jgi:hypothetical protein